MEKFSKSCDSILAPEAWAQNNNILLERSISLSMLYAKQPRRNFCKICLAPLPQKTEFKIRNIGYKKCNQCTHINGEYEDTEDYARYLYESNDPKIYGQNYITPDINQFKKRTKLIYTPKADFLLSALQAENEEISQLSVLDIGAGAGHFLAALDQTGFPHPKGIEISEILVKSAKQYLNDIPSAAEIQLSTQENIPYWIEKEKPKVVTMIGVIEHLTNPQKILNAFKKTEECKYLFISVPMFSPSVCIEAAFPDIYPRHLEGGHTHLFTEKSISWLAQSYNLKKSATWWFGGDITDLFRSILIRLKIKKETANLASHLQEWLPPDTLDTMQASIDLNKKSSELHILLKKQ